MLIKSLTLHNFRQFTDDQTITFSTDVNRKVTFIMAESGVGKTTIIQSFQWILYETCKYSSVLNGEILKKMFPGDSEEVFGTLVINHSGRDYKITRKKKFYKYEKVVRGDDSTLTITYKEDDGLSKQLRGRDADLLIKKIMHRDLFPYFFLEGESLTKVGEQMARGKASSNSDFVKAIKGLLGFNFLYEETKHLDTVIKDYTADIGRNTANTKLSEVIDKITKYENTIDNCNERIANIDIEITDYEGKRDALSNKLVEIGEIASDQSRAKSLTQELPFLQSSIHRKQKSIFDKFSSNGFYLIANSLLNEAKEVLKNSDGMDKGIPGMNIDAINYMLSKHKCICGEELVEGSEHWKMLKDLLNYLPPNNIGYELKTFSNEMKTIENQSQYFDQDLLSIRKDLRESIKNYDSKVDELTELNEKIGGVSEDVGGLKRQEQEYNRKIADLELEKRQKNNAINDAKLNIRNLQKDKELYQQLDVRTKKYQAYCEEASHLKRRIDNFIGIKEKEKREQLSQNINSIFKDFYTEQIKFVLDANYGVHIQTNNKELSDDFTSGGEDVAVALAFIGAIIKINGEKEKNPDDDIDESDEERESYPLVMDAPTSNFGMKQMKSFCNIMPKITDQIIVLINDKDGPILKEFLESEIGEKWLLHKEPGDSYHTTIKKGLE